MKKTLIAINLTAKNYNGVLALGYSVLDRMTDNPNFSDPTPALTVLTSQLADVQAAKVKWGTRSNYGSKEDLIDLRVKSAMLLQTLQELAAYVMSTAQITAGLDNELLYSLVSTSGYTMKRASAPIGRLNPVRNFRRTVSKTLAANQVQLDWDMPDNAGSPKNVSIYKIYRGVMPPQFSTTGMIATTTKATWQETNNTGGMQQYVYYCVASNTDGDSAPSEGVIVMIPSI